MTSGQTIGRPMGVCKAPTSIPDVLPGRGAVPGPAQSLLKRLPERGANRLDAEPAWSITSMVRGRTLHTGAQSRGAQRW